MQLCKPYSNLYKEKVTEFKYLKNQSKQAAYDDYIPIACHYNSRTLLTKNGELLQVIHLDGFARSHDNNSLHSNNMRSMIRSCLHKHLITADLAAHLHIIRDKTTIALNSLFSCKAIQKVEEDWNQKHKWDRQLVNSMFITIIHKGIRSKINIMNSAIFSFICKKSDRLLEKNQEVLSSIVNNITEELKSFGANILTIRKRQEDKKYVSDLLSFYYRLIYLRRKEIEVDICDLSKQLDENISILYHFNYCQITNLSSSKQYYCAFFTLKYPYDLSLEMCDNVLHMDQNFIISETIYPAIESDAIESWQVYKDTYIASNATNIFDNLNLDEISKDKAYCKQQISILLHANELELFQIQLKNISAILKKEGIIVVREDFYMPAGMWSILPGNSKYLSREKYNLLEKAGIFTSIQHRNIGAYNGSRWGEPITIFRDISNVPYYFNFHNKLGSGHTLIIGPKESQGQILLRFLLIQSLRNHPMIMILDTNGNYNNFTSLIEGKNVNLTENFNKISFDVFDQNNFSSKEKWLNIISKALFGSNSAIQDHQIVELFENLAIAEDKVSYIENILENDKISNRSYIESIKNFINSKSYVDYMSSNYLNILKNLQGLMNIDISQISSNYHALYTSMLLTNLPRFFDGMPAIVAIPNFDYCFDLAQEDLHSFLNYADDNNCVVVSNISQKDRFFEQEFLTNLLKKIATKMFLSDRFADKSYKKLFGLTDLELHRIKIYDKNRKIFLLKQDEASISASFDLSENKEVLEIDL